MKCLSCSHSWKRTKMVDYVSLLSKCPNCSIPILARNYFILSLFLGKFTEVAVGYEFDDEKSFIKIL